MSVAALFLFFVVCINAQLLDYDCKSYTHSKPAEWPSVTCTSPSLAADNACDTLNSPVTIDTVDDTQPLGQLRFVDFTDGAFPLLVTPENIIFRYTSEDAQFKNFDSGVGSFSPKNFAVHIPAENRLPEHKAQADMELQLYLASEDGKIAVVSWFFNIGVDNPFLSFLDVSSVDKNGRGVTEITGLQQWLDFRRNNLEDSYYYYVASLSQPPCTANVHYHLFSDTQTISRTLHSQLKAKLGRGNGNSLVSKGAPSTPVRFFNAKDHAVSDPMCGGGTPSWTEGPFDCRDQYDGTVCFFCSGRAHGKEAVYHCLNRETRSCSDIFNSDEAASFCNLEFECPASTLYVPLFLVSALVVLFKLF